MTSTLVNLVGLSEELGLPTHWLKAEALARRIPCLQIGKKLLFNPVAVQQSLAERAGRELAGVSGEVRGAVTV